MRSSSRIVSAAATVAATSLLALSPKLYASAVNGTFVGGGTDSNYSDTANWAGGTVATGAGATATVDLGQYTTNTSATSLTLVLDADETIGTLALTDSTSGQNFQMNGSSTTLTFSASSTPQILLNTYFNKSYSFGAGNLDIAGTQGLSVNTGSNSMFLTSGISWTGFSGTLTVYSTAGAGTLDESAAGLLPATDLNLNGTSGNTIQLGLFSGRNQTIGALVGSQYSYLENNGTSSTMTVVTLGTGSDSGTFAGTIGKTSSAGSGTYDSNISFTKVGTGIETFSGADYSGGTATINAGTLRIDGAHDAVVTTTGNAAAATGTGGLYVVNNGGTLAGTGFVRPFDTAGGGYGINVNTGGVVSPGDGGVGTLTLDNSNSLRTVLGFSGGSLYYYLGSGLTSSEIALIGNSTDSYATVTFSNTTINFDDLTNGSLQIGDYLLFSGDANTRYSGLTESAGTITAGLTVGTGLSGYAYDLQQSGNNIYLDVTSSVPEPGSLGLLGVAAASLLARCRR